MRACSAWRPRRLMRRMRALPVSLSRRSLSKPAGARKISRDASRGYGAGRASARGARARSRDEPGRTQCERSRQFALRRRGGIAHGGQRRLTMASAVRSTPVGGWASSLRIRSARRCGGGLPTISTSLYAATTRTRRFARRRFRVPDRPVSDWKAPVASDQN